MPKIAIVKDIYHPVSDLKAYDTVAPGTTLWQYLENKFPGFEEFETPTMCKLNGEDCMRAEWKTRPLQPEDQAVFIPVVGTSVIIAIVVAIIVALVVVLFMDFAIPRTDGQPEADPVYSFRGQQNQMKPGDVIERHYGMGRHWPSFASRPYNQFDASGDEYAYLLFCVGLGEYQIDNVLVDDTAVSELQDVTYEIYAPGENVTLFPTNVQTAAEVNGIEMLGPNEDDYDWSGGYMIAPPGSRIYRIELDLSFRQGLYRQNDKGKFKAVSVYSQFQYRQVDDDGNPIGSWVTLLNFGKSMKAFNAMRYTVGANVTPGRYEVRGRRTSNKSDDVKVRDTFHWERCRGFCETKQNFGNVTLLAIKARATNNLNDQSQNKFNIRYQAFTDVWDASDQAWVPSLTRNPVWAMCDILRADYGRGLPTRFLDMEVLTELAGDIEAAGIHFDWTFDQRGTVWPAMQLALNVARAKPILPNAVFSAVRDVPMANPSIGFNPHNIIRGSFSVGTKLSNFGEPDGLEVEYINPDTWKKETVLCLINEDQGINPRQVRLSGCTDRNAAYRWGLYTRACELFQKDNIVFETGIEGATAIYGDLAVLQHDLLPVEYENPPEHTGRLEHDAFSIVEIAGVDYTAIRLPKDVEFEDGETHRISLRDRKGNIRGPFICHQLAPNEVRLTSLLDLTQFEVDQWSEPPTYFFGVSGKEMMLAKIVKIEPSGDQQVRMTLIPYDERVYTYDDAIAPPIDTPSLPPITPDAPVVEGLTVEMVANSLTQAMATWIPALGASSYVVLTSTDGETFVEYDTVTTSSCVIEITDTDTLWVRVYGVGVLAGPYDEWSGELGTASSPPGQVEGLRLEGASNGPTMSFVWGAEELADGYYISFYVGANLLATYDTKLPAFLYPGAQAFADAQEAGLDLTGTLNVVVTAYNTFDEGLASSPISVTNSMPTSPLRSAASVNPGAPSGFRDLRVTWNNPNTDLRKNRILVGATAGFNPDGTEGTDYYVAYEGTENSAIIRFPSGWSNAWIKFRTYDFWHHDTSSPYSDYTQSAGQQIYPAW